MKHLRYLLAALTLGGGLLAGCNAGPGTTGKEPDAVGGAPGISPDSIVIGALPPHDLPRGSNPVLLAEFAWAEFIALNWQASYHQPGQAAGQDTLRDNPDLNWDYAKSDTTSLTVWETYAHRTELRPASDSMKPFDRPPHYSFGVKPAGVPLTQFDNLDEDSEIGSCVVYHLPTPTTAPDPTGGEHLVLYQAKVNRAEYNYIQANYRTGQQLAQARTATLANIQTYGRYSGAGPDSTTSTCDDLKGVICLPCGNQGVKGAEGQGTIEIKSAWRRLTKNDTASHFITRKVLYYTQTVNANGRDTVQTAHYGRYALIALHIIHKTRNYPAFVFATFEHVGVQDTQHPMAYQLLDSKGYLNGKPNVDYGRPHAITAVNNAVTAAAHAALTRKRPHSVLQYYRLGGVQGTPTNDAATPDFYLANYVVESDNTLAAFRGSGIGTPHNIGCNVLVPGQASLSVGGCQGCHGVAQTTLGTDFSFLLDGVGKPVRFPDPASASLPPGPAALAQRRLPAGSTPRLLTTRTTTNLSPADLQRALRANQQAPGAAPLGKLGRYIQATAR